MTATEAEHEGLTSPSVSPPNAPLDWAQRIFSLGQHVVAEIDKIKWSHPGSVESPRAPS